MDIKWLSFSLFLGLVFSVLFYFIYESFLYSFLAFVFVTAITIYYNPQTRYMRTARWILVALLLQNAIELVLKGSIGEVNFSITLAPSVILNIGLSLAIIVLYVLDFMERNKLKLTKLVHVGDEIGTQNNQHINQQNNQYINQQVNNYFSNQDKVNFQGEELSYNTFEPIRKLNERRKELSILAENDPSGKIYNTEIQEIEEQLAEEKKKISDLLKKVSNLLEDVNKHSSQKLIADKIKKAREAILNGNYSKAKDCMIDIEAAEFRIKFLDFIGVSPEYTHLVDYEINEGHESSDGLLYDYVVNFSEDTPSNILETIPGITKDAWGYSLIIAAHELDNLSDKHNHQNNEDSDD